MKHFFSWRAAILASDLPATTRHVLLTLSCHMNDLGQSCFPSMELLAAETGLSKRSVVEHISIARALGWICSRKHGYAGRAWARSEYWIPELDALPSSSKHEVSERRMQRALTRAIASGKLVWQACACGSMDSRAVLKPTALAGGVVAATVDWLCPRCRGGEPGSPPSEAGNVLPRRGEGRSSDVGKELPSNSSVNNLKSSPGDTAGQEPALLLEGGSGSKGKLEPAEMIEQLRQIYPQRRGDHRWGDAERNLAARLREGSTFAEILEGAKRYAAYCKAERIEGSEFVQQIATFLGRNRGFANDWKPKPKPGSAGKQGDRVYGAGAGEKPRW